MLHLPKAINKKNITDGSFSKYKSPLKKGACQMCHWLHLQISSYFISKYVFIKISNILHQQLKMHFTLKPIKSSQDPFPTVGQLRGTEIHQPGANRSWKKLNSPPQTKLSSGLLNSFQSPPKEVKTISFPEDYTTIMFFSVFFSL